MTKSKQTKTHFTWSIEKPNNTCPFCDGQVVLATPFSTWELHVSDDNTDLVESLMGGADVLESMDGSAEIGEEVSGHYCPECRILTSLSLNT